MKRENEIDINKIEQLTPEYIAEISLTISKEELIELIRDYGNQESDNSSYWAGKNL